MEDYKIVLLPFFVPKGNYCKTISRLCPQLEAEGLQYFCKYRSESLEMTDAGKVKKPKDCLELTEAK